MISFEAIGSCSATTGSCGPAGAADAASQHMENPVVCADHQEVDHAAAMQALVLGATALQGTLSISAAGPASSNLPAIHPGPSTLRPVSLRTHVAAGRTVNDRPGTHPASCNLCVSHFTAPTAARLSPMSPLSDHCLNTAVWLLDDEEDLASFEQGLRSTISPGACESQTRAGSSCLD